MASTTEFDQHDTNVEPASTTRVARDTAWTLIIGGILGALSAARLAIEYMNSLADPNYVPGCDINPYIGCGQFLGSSQAQAFGFPNVVLGMLTFPVVILIGVLLASRIRLPRFIWFGFLAGTVFGIGFVTWLQFQAVFTIGALCPWCLVVWAAMIPIFVHTLLATPAQIAGPGASESILTRLYRYRWIFVILWYLVVMAIIMFGLGVELIAMF